MKVCIFLADGFEEIEGLTVVDLLRRAQIDIRMVSITGSYEVTGAHKIKIIADSLFEDENFDDCDMLVLPGGMPGTKHLAAHNGLRHLLKEFNSNKKYLSAICAAPSVFGEYGFLEDKCATSYPDFYHKLTGAKVTKARVEVDGHIITSKGLGTSIDFALAIIRVLKDDTTANQIATSIQYI